MPSFFRLTGDVLINVADIVYIRRSESGGSYVELRTGRGFEDSRDYNTLILALRSTMGQAHG